jgi:hypothetical protein
MTVIAIQRIRDGVAASADTATLEIEDSTGATVFGPATIAAVTAGNYSYDTAALAAGNYTATWVFTTAGDPTDTVVRPFTVDAISESTSGITLMQLERLVARRIGPYRRLRCGAGGSASSIYVPRLRSTLDLGANEDLFILRRGLTYGDLLVANAVADDRIRQVDTYTASTGILVPDRTYTTPTMDGEAVELHVLDPDDELRPAVIDGLKRCFFWDTVSISVTGSGIYNVNLTSAVPWLTQPHHVNSVSLSYPSQLLPPTRLGWWEPYRDGGDVRIRTKGGAVGTISVVVLRPVFSLVNGATSLTGPDNDLDEIQVDPDYAAWAGALECWKNHPETLQPLAAQNMRPSRQDAAAEFSKKSMSIVQQMPEKISVDFGSADIVQIGNLAEPA